MSDDETTTLPIAKRPKRKECNVLTDGTRRYDSPGRLHALDADSLRLIVYWLKLDDILRLFMTGNVRLRYSLTGERVVTTLRYEETSTSVRKAFCALHAVCTWSQQFCFVKEVTLRPHPHFGSVWSVRQGPEPDLKNLPASMTRLEIGMQLSSVLNESDIAILPKTLVHIALPYQRALTDACITHLPEELTYLDLQEAHKLTRFCVPSLPSGLLHLNLASNRSFDDASIRLLPRTLTFLNLSSSCALTDACAAHFPPDLVYLNLAKSGNLTDVAIGQLPRGIAQLYLNLNSRLTDAAIEAFPTQLTHLDVTSASLTYRKLSAALPLLKVLCVAGCSYLSSR